MSTAARQERILRYILEQDSASVGELSSLLSASPATIRRDLHTLDRKGLLQRTHGGARPFTHTFYDSLVLDSSFEDQVNKHANEKQRIGLAAARMVVDNSVVSLTPGTTTANVARNIVDRTGVTVIVTAINIAMELSGRDDLNIVLPGGFMRPSWFSLIGPSTLRNLREFFSDIAFVGVVGIDATNGLTSSNHDEAAVNRVMMDRSRKSVIVADHSKLGATGTFLIADIEAVDALITGTEATDESIAPFQEKGIEVIRV